MVDPDDFKGDKMRAVHIRIEQSMQISLLAMILNINGSSERCIEAAHASLDVHEQCIQLMHENKPFMRMNYTNWSAHLRNPHEAQVKNSSFSH